MNRSEMESLTRRAVELLDEAVVGGVEFAGWLSSALAEVAARHGQSSWPLVQHRPGSWESAALVALVPDGLVEMYAGGES